MFKSLKVQLFGSLLLVGIFSTSCEKQEFDKQADSLQTEQAVQVTAQNIASIMAADPLVKEFIAANESFLNQYDRWYSDLSTQQKAQYRAARREALNNGELLPEKFTTQKAITQHHQAQVKRALQIKEKYAVLYDLSNDEQARVKREVYAAVVGAALNSKSTGSTTGPANAGPIDHPAACHAAYTDCSWYCYDHGGASSCYGACKAGYDTCMGA